MDIKKIKVKNSGVTLTGVVISLIIVMGIFFGMFNYMNKMGENSDVEIPSKYNSTYYKLQDEQTAIDEKNKDIRYKLNNISEADDTYQVAWNGLKGLGSTLLLPIAYIDYAVNVMDAIIDPVDFVPSWVNSLVVMGVIILIVFLILAVLKGEQKM